MLTSAGSGRRWLSAIAEADCKSVSLRFGISCLRASTSQAPTMLQVLLPALVMKIHRSTRRRVLHVREVRPERVLGWVFPPWPPCPFSWLVRDDITSICAPGISNGLCSTNRHLLIRSPAPRSCACCGRSYLSSQAGTVP